MKKTIRSNSILRFLSLSRYYTLLLCFFSAGLCAQPMAAFKATDTAGCAPLVIRFTNLSAGATSYSWNLGNTVSSTATDVSGTYVAAGTYTVTLTAINGSSRKDSSIIIRAYGKPTMSFTTNDSTVCPNDPITFTSTSTPNAWGGLTYTWNFGDGNSLSSSTATYAYPLPGRYNLTLFATNSKGCNSAVSKTGHVTVYTQPVVSLTAKDYFLCRYPAKDTFTNTTTGKPPFVYTWAFGDGGTATTTHTAHTYTAPGTYKVVLQAKDGNGCMDSTKADIEVSGFRASFTAVPAACSKTTITFINTSPASNIQSNWNYGDGGTSSFDMGQHSWNLLGTYPVRLVAYDGHCYDTITHPVAIQKPVAAFITTQACTPPRSTLIYTATAVPGNSFSWKLADGSTTTGNPATKLYPTDSALPALKKTTMYVEDALGCKDTTSATDTIKNKFLSFDSSKNTSGCVPLTTTFEAHSYYTIRNPRPPCPNPGCIPLTLPYTMSVISYTWDFGDGSGTSTGFSPSHTYTAVGRYRARCRVVYADGCIREDTLQVRVGTRQSATFTLSPSRACFGQPINYTVTSATPLVDEYWWGRDSARVEKGAMTGSVVDEQELGANMLYLVAKYNGCPSIAYGLPFYIDSPVSSIRKAYTCIPYNGVAFQSGGVGEDTRLWEFGDGTTDTSRNPIHYFPDLVQYITKLTVYNARSGCSHTESVTSELGRLSRMFSITGNSGICLNASDTFYLAHNILEAHIKYLPEGTVIPAYPVQLNWYNNGVSFLTQSSPDSVIKTMTGRGNNVISLTIRDDRGCLDTFKPFNVIVAKPRGNFSFTPATACPLSDITFTDLSTDVPGTFIADHYWDFGDNETANTTLSSIKHQYTAAGSYSVKEIMTDNFGCSDTFTSVTRPSVSKPSANFSTTTYLCANDSVTFSTGGASKYFWSFGDGATATTTTQPMHKYTTAGDYTVSLVAYNVAGCTDTLVKKDYINVHPNPKASFYMTDSFAVCPPLNVNFINTSTGAVASQWLFGDGNYSADLYPNNIYVSRGNSVVNLTVSNQYGCISTALGNVSIFGYAGAFSYSPLSVCTSVPVSFKAPLSHVINVVWDFDDGVVSDPSLTDSTTHRYTTAGKYLPKLFLTDVGGCSSFSQGADTITVDSVIAAFGATPNPVCRNSVVSFRDSSSSYFSAVSSWSWSFGSSAASTVRSPSYTYTLAGTQPVTLQVTNAKGCTSSITKNLIVNPVPAPITGPSDICLGSTAAMSTTTGGGTWSSGNTAVATIDGTGLATTVRTGSATITYTLPTGCNAIISATVNALPAAITGSTRMCVSDSRILSNATGGGTWSISNTTVATVAPGTGAVTGVAAGTATLTYGLPSGCVATTLITIDSTPSAIYGSAAICAGNTIVLTNAVGGGVWSSANTSIAIAGSTGIVTGAGAGTATISYVLPSGCGVSITATVNPLPTAITGAGNVCTGLETLLTISNTIGTWSSSNTAIATITTAGYVMGHMPGTATITYTLPSGCIATKVITVDPLPAGITGVRSICAGSTAMLSNTTAGGTWSTTETTVSINAITGMATGIAAGTATVTYTAGSGCIATAAVTIQPLPALISGPSNVCMGVSSIFSNTDAGGVWTTAATTISIGATTGVVLPIRPGAAIIIYTLPTGCYTTSAIVANPIPPAIKGKMNVCPGATTLLTNGSTGGSWSSSNATVASVTGSGLASGISPGSAVITYTTAAGCITTATISVYPLTPPFTGAGRVCNGDTVTLSDEVKGGIWSSNNTAVATIDAKGTITGISPGTVTLSYQTARTCGVYTASFIVDPLPDAGTLSGNPGVCVGASTLFTSTVVGGRWTCSGAGIITIDSTGLVHGLYPGPATVTYTYKNICGSSVKTIPVVVNAGMRESHITTHPDTTLCSNTLFQNFGADMTPAPGVKYVWTASNATIYATGTYKQYCLVMFNEPGTSVIRLSANHASSYCSFADSIIFKINNNKSPAPTVLYYAGELVCTDNTADNFQWGYDDARTLDSTLLQGMVNQNMHVEGADMANKLYWVLTNHKGCLQKSYYIAPVDVNIMHSESKFEILLYPNPAEEEIEIEIKGVERSAAISARFFDMLGKEFKFTNIANCKAIVKVNELVPGVYSIRFEKEGRTIGSKIFVKK